MVLTRLRSAPVSPSPLLLPRGRRGWSLDRLLELSGDSRAIRPRGRALDPLDTNRFVHGSSSLCIYLQHITIVSYSVLVTLVQMTSTVAFSLCRWSLTISH